MVLLRNRTLEGAEAPVLPLHRNPLHRNPLRRIAVLGRIADLVNLGDRGSSNVHADGAITPAAGLREALPDAEVLVDDASDLDRATALAEASDAAVLIVGYTAREEGEWVNGRVYARDDLMRLYPEPVNDDERAVLAEMLERLEAAKGSKEIGGDRSSLRLPEDDVALIKAVAAQNPNCIVVVAAGAVLMDEWIDDPAAVVMGWYSGVEGGRALADLLLGDEDFTGRMPYAIPRSESDLPEFEASATRVVYDRWYGQRRLAARGVDALVPLGYGLSYSEVAIRDASEFVIDGTKATLIVRAENLGGASTRAVVQVYAQRLEGERTGERELVGYASLPLEPGKTSEASISLDLLPLARWNAEARDLILSPGTIRLEASRYWGDPDAIALEAII